MSVKRCAACRKDFLARLKKCPLCGHKIGDPVTQISGRSKEESKAQFFSAKWQGVTVYDQDELRRVLLLLVLLLTGIAVAVLTFW